MATRRETGPSVVDGRQASTNAHGSPRVRVWGAVTLTIAITSDPPQFVKYEFGHERLVNNNPHSIARAEKAIHEFNEQIVQDRIEEYRQLAEEMTR